jgi:hypothetical protein
VFFGLADSSPQGGKNWLLTEEFCVAGDVLLDVSLAITDMCLSAQRDDLQAVAEPMKAWRDFVASCIQHHVYPPTALGSRHANLTHKAHCMLHAKRLECNSWVQVQQLLDAHFSSTSDSGVEASLHLVETTVGELFPHWLQMDIGGDEAGGNVDQLQGGAVGDHAGLKLSSLRAIPIPGTFHMIDNVQKRLLGHFQHWEAVKPLLESACVFFTGAT